MIDPVEQQQLSLDSILSDEKPAPREPATPAAPAAEKPMPDIPVLGDSPLPEQQKIERPISRKVAARDKEQLAQGRVRDPETGQYVKVEEKPEEPAKAATPPAKEEPAKPAAPVHAAPQQEFTEKEKAFLRAAQEERSKRQELERRLAAIEAAKPQEPAKTFWDDPEAALAKQKQELQQAVIGMRLQTAEGIARARYPDFDAKVAVFSELAMSTPGLGQQMLQASDPAEFVYRTAANHMAIKEAGGVEALLAKKEAETRAKVRTEIEAELKAKAEELAKDRAALPGSLSDARSTGAANRQVWSGPPSLEDILKG